MRCRKCSHAYAEHLTNCPRCGLAQANEGTKSNSTLIEFPINKVQPESTVPAWRAELSARVRAARAQRRAQSETPAAPVYNPAARMTGPARQTALALDPPPLLEETVEVAPAENVEEHSEETRETNPIVEAALRRLQRVTEPPSAGPSAAPARPKAFVPVQKVEPIRKEPAPPASEAPAVTRTLPAPQSLPAPPAAADTLPAPRPERTIATLPVQEYEQSITEAKYERESLEYDYEADRLSSTSSKLDPDAQLEQLLHLGATEFDEAARVGQRLIAGLLDLIVIALATSPFAVALWYLQVDLREPRVLAVLGGLMALIAFTYSIVTVGLVGRTAGMSFTGIHVLSLRTGKQPTVLQATVRASGHLLSAACLLFGYFWIVLGAERRSWHDMLSNTSVVRDY